MDKVVIMKELFKKRATEEMLSGLSAGQNGPKGLTSRYNQTVTGTAKISNVIYSLSRLLMGNVKVLYDDNLESAYVEITYTPSKKIKALVSTKGVYHDDMAITPEDIVDLLSVFSLCNYDSELEEILKDVHNEYVSNGTLSLVNALKVSDNTYYNVLSKLEKSFDVEEKKTLEEEVKQSIRSGGLKEAEMLKEYNCKDISIVVNVASEETDSPEISNDVMTVLDECKAGKFRINYDWGENSIYIPSLDVLDTFVPTKHFIPLIRKIDKKVKRILTRMDMGKTGREAIGHDYINIEFTGRPGTGKTTLAEALAAVFGFPIYVSKNSDDVEDDEFEGKTKPIDGQFSFVETTFLKGFTNGGFIVDEEYNLTKPGIKMGAIGQAIEAPFILKRNGYEDVTRHPLTIYIATSNAQTEGTKETNQALSSRNKNAYAIEDPDDETFIKILKSWDVEFKTTDCKKVLDAYKKIINFLCDRTIDAPEIALKITIRQCIGALETIYEGNSFKYAIETSMIGKIFQSDPELAVKVRRSILDNLRD